MNYTKILVQSAAVAERELWLGILSQMDAIIGTEELDNDQIIAYTSDWDAVAPEIASWSEQTEVAYSITEVPEENWNATWEANFEPVVIEGFCSVRAHFHAPIPGVQYDIKITPKMSFGTGHHATTRLVMGQMREMDFQDKRVFDYGTGTGILAILAEFLGARSVDAVDIDEWSYENALENVANNDCKQITIGLGDISWLQAEQEYDIILANINRHILLESMGTLSKHLVTGGYLLLSGILKLQDTNIIVDKAKAAGFEMQQQTEENGWTAILFKKA
jgi:ribosomal protein L11 methyltransferase